MLLEYINYSHDLTEVEIVEILSLLPDNISTIIIPSHFLKTLKNKIKTNTKISCLIDFPLGISDPESRLSACNYAIKNKCDFIDIVIPTNLLANRKYDKIREEIKKIKDLSKDDVGIRYILEYRAFSHASLKKICEILHNFELFDISLSTGYGADVLSDLIIAKNFINTHRKCNIFMTANFWLDKHIKLIAQNDFYAIRSSSVFSLNQAASLGVI
jgi:deoxyribose-phosphate aldolase